MRTPRTFLSWCLLGVLMLGVAARVVGFFLVPQKKLHGTIAEILPQAAAVPGWSVAPLGVAGTPEMEARVKKVLNYDQAESVAYERGNTRVSFFVAYWKPGTQSRRLVAEHTPDVCWVDAGWAPTLKESTRLDGLAPPARMLDFEHRTFVLAGQKEHVVFTHLIEGRALNDPTGRRSSRPDMLGRWLDDFKLRQDAEQIFIRISSNQPLADFASSAPVQEFFRSLSSVYPLEPEQGRD